MFSSEPHFYITPTKFWFFQQTFYWNEQNLVLDSKTFVKTAKILLGQQTNLVYSEKNVLESKKSFSWICLNPNISWLPQLLTKPIIHSIYQKMLVKTTKKFVKLKKSFCDLMVTGQNLERTLNMENSIGKFVYNSKNIIPIIKNFSGLSKVCSDIQEKGERFHYRLGKAISSDMFCTEHVQPQL